MALMVALSSAVSGLKSEQTALDVIANNIANVNTTAYKSQTVSFSDLLSQTISAASGATSSTGSVNAQQVGLGVQVASTTTNLTVGSTSATSNSFDVALTGSGYLIVEGSTEGDYLFSRNGSMTVDDEGNLTIDGSLVCGWEAYTLDADGNKVYNTDGAVEAINIWSDSYSGNKETLAASATTSGIVKGVVDSGSDVVTGATLQNIGSTAITDWDATTTLDVIDEQGNTSEITVNMKKCATDGTTTSWYWEASGTDTTISPSSGYIAFDSDGTLVSSVTTSTATAGTNSSSYAATNLTLSTGLTTGAYSVTVAASTTTTGQYDVTLVDADGNTTTTTSADGSATFSTDSGTVTIAAPTTITAGTMNFTVAAGTTMAFDTTPAITVASTTGGTQAVSVELDFTGISTASNEDATLTATNDGYESGTSESYSIANDGTINCTYTNGEIRSVGQIALAVFENASGLEKTGGGLYTASISSGDYRTVVAGENGSGTMTSYALELSNVDLAEQFSAMMIAQRAYQANSKVISTSDDMLQSLINMVS